MVNFRRKLGLVENLFATLHSMGAMIYVNVASIQGMISLDVFRAALDLLQKRHPLLQVHLQEADDGVFFCAEGTLRIPLTVIERQHEQQWIEITEGELLQKFSGEFDPLCRITLLQTSERSAQSELIMTFHHAIADGISAIHFVHELLFYYQQLVEGIPISPIESLPMLPSLEQLLQRCLSEIDITDFTSSTPKHSLPNPTLLIEQAVPVVDRQTRLIPRELNQSLTSQIKSRCHDEQTTVHGALCAAMILSCVQQLSAEEPVSVSCGSSVNLRASCFPPVGSEHLGYFNSNVTTIHHAAPNIDFWELARECRSSINQLVQHRLPQYQVSNAELLSKYQPSFLAQIAEHNMGRNSTIHVSNLGQWALKTSYGSIRLESFYFTVGLSLIGSCFWLGTTTINQKLCCTFTYVDPLVSAKTAEALADSVINILSRKYL